MIHQESLPIITLIILFITVIIIVLLAVFGAANPVVNCPPDYCATNVTTGSKRCDGSPLRPLEVCNPKYSCSSPATPYALRSDGGVNSDGNCEREEPCPCLGIPRCPYYIASVFNSTVPSTSSTNLSYTQSADPASIGSSYCTLSTGALTLGPCNYYSEMNYNNLVECAGLSVGCESNLFSVPCSSGILSLITDNPDAVNKETYQNYQVGCVYTEPCPCGSLPIYNTQTNKRVCK